MFSFGRYDDVIGIKFQYAFIGVVMLACSVMAGSYAPTATTNDFNNPHKGFMLWGTDYAAGAPVNHYGATIYHIYVPWREIETADQVFDWGRFETNHLRPILTVHSNATFVLRPVVDYPNGPGSGISLFYIGGDLHRDFPSFITNDPISIPVYPYTSCDGDGPGVTPDWNHHAMITQLVEFVQAFALRYDGDPRITAIQVGLLGLWGEWHQSGCNARAPSNAVKIAVRDAYAAGFTNTPLQTRYPRNPDATGVTFGFHEDYFPSFTAPCIYGFPSCSAGGDWNLHYCYLHVNPAASNNWRHNPISGESPGTSQKHAWSNDFDDVMTVLRDYHFSFLGPAGGHQWNGNQAKLIPMKQLLGYNYHIRRVDWPDMVYLGHAFPVTLVLTNSGAAPCYHRFPVEIALCDYNGIPLWRETWSFDLRELVPGLDFEREEWFTVTNLAPGEYSLRVAILDQRTGEPGVRIQSAGEDARYRIVIGQFNLVDAWTVDTDGDGLPDGWEYEHFGGFTNAVPDDDADNDGYSNWEHYVSGTNPTNANSYCRLTWNSSADSPALVLDTEVNRIYTIQQSGLYPFASWLDIFEDFNGDGNALLISVPTPLGQAGYRVRVRVDE